jgi:hypothetical protein
MGFMNALFGGGTKLELKLDAAEVPAGGQLSGQITVQGGKKPLTVTSLFVRLLLVSVKTKEGSSIPDIDTRLLVDSVIATNDPLPPGELKKYSFRFPIPTGLLPSDHSTSYTVMAQADIPGVADPKADTKLKVVEGRGDGVVTVEAIYARYPDLRSAEPDEQVMALCNLSGDCYSEREQLIAAEPLLRELMRESRSPAVRREAFSTWANLVDNQVTKEHLAFLAQVAESATDDERLFREVITAAAKFAEEGARPMVESLTRHPDPSMRLHLAQQLRFSAARRFKGKREIIDAMAQDPDSRVRAAAVEAWTEWRDDPNLIRYVVGLADSDPSPEVQSAVMSVVALAHNYGGGTLALDVFERHLQNPHAEVRKTIAESLQWLPESEIVRIQGLVALLLGDKSGEVRESMAFQLQNLSELKQLRPLAEGCFLRDPSEDVRKDAFVGLCALSDPEGACRLCEQALASQPSDTMLWGVLGGLRHHREAPCAQQLLAQLAAGSSCVASAARDELSR